MYTTKESVEYYVWNEAWHNTTYLRIALRENVEDHVDDELLQRVQNNVPRALLLSIGGAIPLGIELKATLNQELRKYEY
jgi:hypothetical protein